MLMYQEELIVETEGRGSYELTERVNNVVAGMGIVTGLCHVFIKHTSCLLYTSDAADE